MHLAAENSQEAQEWFDTISNKLTQYSLMSANTLRKAIKEEEDKTSKSEKPVSIIKSLQLFDGKLLG